MKGLSRLDMKVTSAREVGVEMRREQTWYIFDTEFSDDLNVRSEEKEETQNDDFNF